MPTRREPLPASPAPYRKVGAFGGMRTESWRVRWTYNHSTSATTFGSEECARKFASDLRARGIRVVVVSKV